jgi:hypothetical protein
MKMAADWRCPLTQDKESGLIFLGVTGGAKRQACIRFSRGQCGHQRRKLSTKERAEWKLSNVCSTHICQRTEQRSLEVGREVSSEEPTNIPLKNNGPAFGLFPWEKRYIQQPREMLKQHWLNNILFLFLLPFFPSTLCPKCERLTRILGDRKGRGVTTGLSRLPECRVPNRC